MSRAERTSNISCGWCGTIFYVYKSLCNGSRSKHTRVRHTYERVLCRAATVGPMPFVRLLPPKPPNICNHKSDYTNIIYYIYIYSTLYSTTVCTLWRVCSVHGIIVGICTYTWWELWLIVRIINAVQAHIILLNITHLVMLTPIRDIDAGWRHRVRARRGRNCFNIIHTIDPLSHKCESIAQRRRTLKPLTPLANVYSFQIEITFYPSRWCNVSTISQCAHPGCRTSQHMMNNQSTKPVVNIQTSAKPPLGPRL